MNTDRWTASLARALALGACLLLAAGCGGITVYSDIRYNEGRGYKVDLKESPETGGDESEYFQYVFDTYEGAAAFVEWIGQYSSVESFYILEEHYEDSLQRGYPGAPLPELEPYEEDYDGDWQIVTGPVPPQDEDEEEEEEEEAEEELEGGPPAINPVAYDPFTRRQAPPSMPMGGSIEHTFDILTPVPLWTTNPAN